MAYEYIPWCWRQVKVTFIPKSGKCNYTQGKVYHPVSLSSLSLKMVKNLADRCTMDGELTGFPLCWNQFALQAGRSAETTLHMFFHILNVQ
jgi:hypothetical protein